MGICRMLWFNDAYVCYYEIWSLILSIFLGMCYWYYYGWGNIGWPENICISMPQNVGISGTRNVISKGSTFFHVSLICIIFKCSANYVHIFLISGARQSIPHCPTRSIPISASYFVKTNLRFYLRPTTLLLSVYI